MYRTLELVKPFTCISFDSDDTARVCVVIPFHRCGNWGSLWLRDFLKITHWVYGKASPQTGACKCQDSSFFFFFFFLLAAFLVLKPLTQNETRISKCSLKPSRADRCLCWLQAQKNPGYLPLIPLLALTSVPPKSAQQEASRGQQRGPLKTLIRLPF